MNKIIFQKDGWQKDLSTYATRIQCINCIWVVVLDCILNHSLTSNFLRGFQMWLIMLTNVVVATSSQGKEILSFLVLAILDPMHIITPHPHTNAYALHFTSLDDDNDASIQIIMKNYCIRKQIFHVLDIFICIYYTYIFSFSYFSS